MLLDIVLNPFVRCFQFNLHCYLSSGIHSSLVYGILWSLNNCLLAKLIYATQGRASQAGPENRTQMVKFRPRC